MRQKEVDHITPTMKQLQLLHVPDLLYLREATMMIKIGNNFAL